MPVLTNYVTNAMCEATYKILEDGSYYGEIEKCPGVWANEKTLEQCRMVLQEVLEEWLLLKLRDRDPLPQLGGIDLNKVVAEA
ncbi:type II toxin-antitoxin system HicB family antitoxin [Desulfoscipio geothermicus]|uniref:Predicted nuclease of the RNAse H fold, HicB family n=1 Tax=Desulfoscipio geothermicus DSM 3669 TaxID=1121426 RepID=A0A1I6E1V1_9FIRM|nr:type II toxin-antitoxin system HicB family antitoxin [Desulfoscipio geothermicus]SFR11552.1 Predicted nuclease of the RNAse H fold, HicB family [Desulfoscipio geothermicus DSM 3669]